MESLNNYLVVKKEVIEEKRSEGGIILNVSSVFHEDFIGEMENRNVCYAEVVFDNNENIPFIKAGERIAINPNKGTRGAMDYEEYTILTGNQVLAKIDKDGKFIVPPSSVMVKIKNEDKEALYTKWIIKDDGSKVQLFLQSEPDQMDSRRSSIFVSTGEIVQVGENVTGLQEGDTAILDYTVDNFTDNVLYYDDEKNKYVVIDAVTTFHTGNTWAYANRDNPRDNLVSKSGDMDISSPLLGVIRNEELIARQPYVFLEHKSNTVETETNSGIKHSYEEDIIQREVLAVSEVSNKKYGIKKGQKIIVDNYDVFDIQLREYKIQAILDSDVFGGFK